MYDAGTTGNIPAMYGASLFVIIAALTVWDWVWKAIAMWHAARRGEKVWFVVILIFNTIGILPIVYLALVAKVWSKGGTDETGAISGGS